MTGVWIAYSKALTQQRRQEEPSQWIERSHDSHHGFKSTFFAAAKEHIKSKATTGRLPLASSTPKLFLRQPEHKWNVFSFLVCHAALHTENVNVVMCGGQRREFGELFHW